MINILLITLFIYSILERTLIIPINIKHQIKKKFITLSLLVFCTLSGYSIINSSDVHAQSQYIQNNSTPIIAYSNTKLPIASSHIIPSNSASTSTKNNTNVHNLNTQNNTNFYNTESSNITPSNAQSDNKVASYDISDWQGDITNSQAQQLKHEVNFMILKADEGGYEDVDYANNSYRLRQVNMPYGAYDYSVYSNPTQAQYEASSLVKQAPYAKFYVNDSEVNDAGVLLDSSTQAWANEIHALTHKPAILYSDLSFLNGFSQYTRNLYNGIWVAAYGVEPDPSWHYDLWQFSSNHYSPALNEDVDASVFPDGNNKPLSFWTGHNNYSYHPTHNNYVRNYMHYTYKHKRKYRKNHLYPNKTIRYYRTGYFNAYGIWHRYARHKISHTENSLYKYTRKITRHTNKRYKHKLRHNIYHMRTSNHYYHKIPQAQWLEVTNPNGIELYGKHHKYVGMVSKGTILYVSRYIKVRNYHHYIYEAQGIHYGMPDWFTANKSYMTDNC